MSDPPRLDYAAPDVPPTVKPTSVGVGIGGTLAYGALLVPAVALWIENVSRHGWSRNSDFGCFAIVVTALGCRFVAAVRHLVRSLGRRRADR